MGPKYDYDHDERINASRYSDPTAFAAIQRVDSEAIERRNKFLHTIWHMAECAGFRIDGRIEMTDLVTGREWK